MVTFSMWIFGQKGGIRLKYWVYGQYFLQVFVCRSMLALKVVVLDADLNSASIGDIFKRSYREKMKSFGQNTKYLIHIGYFTSGLEYFLNAFIINLTPIRPMLEQDRARRAVSAALFTFPK